LVISISITYYFDSNTHSAELPREADENDGIEGI